MMKQKGQLNKLSMKSKDKPNISGKMQFMLVCFYDIAKKRFSKKIYSEQEFRDLMSKRKIDPIWKQIYFIQQMIPRTRYNNFDNLFHVQFDFETYPPQTYPPPYTYP